LNSNAYKVYRYKVETNDGIAPDNRLFSSRLFFFFYEGGKKMKIIFLQVF